MTAATPASQSSASQSPAAPATAPAAAPAAAPAVTGRREFPFEKRHFEFIARMLYQLAGIALAPHKVEMVYSRLARRLRELNLTDFDAYCTLLESEDGGNEIGFLVNALTTNLTSFFRESHHFDFLAKTVVPDIRARHGGESSRPRLRLWSAGCSSGQEPYTIAMVLAAAFGPELRRWDAKILATDIDTHMIDTARRGVYPAEVATSIPGPLRDRFTRRLREDGEAKIAVEEELKRLITFKPLNLLEHWPMKGPFDAIFCRNVLIYFDRAGRTQVIENFARLLEPGGCLFLGHSESLYGVSNRFRQTGPTIYRRL